MEPKPGRSRGYVEHHGQPARHLKQRGGIQVAERCGQ
jgi:hypothetical protein